MMRKTASADERQLLKLFQALNPPEREMLLAFAGFLIQRMTPEQTVPEEPESLPRPTTETVIAAIKRLSRTYPMLDHSRLLNETSTLMSAHVLQGRDATQVIDELEAVFARHYQDYRHPS